MQVGNIQVKTKLSDSLKLIDWFAVNLMKVNPDKFQVIAIGRKTCDKNISFHLNNNIIKCEDEIKLLGITIDYQLKFYNHIHVHVDNICYKLDQSLSGPESQCSCDL